MDQRGKEGVQSCGDLGLTIGAKNQLEVEAVLYLKGRGVLGSVQKNPKIF